MKKRLLLLVFGSVVLHGYCYAGESTDFDYYKSMGISKDDRISFEDPSKYGYGKAQWDNYFIMDTSVGISDLERAPGTLVLKNVMKLSANLTIEFSESLTLITTNILKNTYCGSILRTLLSLATLSPQLVAILGNLFVLFQARERARRLSSIPRITR